MPKDRKRPIQPEDIYLLRTVSDPQVSPDGKRVAYVVSWNDRDSDEIRMAVHVAPVDGRQPARRFTQGTRDHSPRWSPDGHYLAFVSRRGEKNQLFLAPLDGGEPRQVTKARFGISQPAWSPDGKRVAYVARVGEYKESKERNPIERAAPRVIRDLRYKLDGIGFFDERRLHIFTVDIESGAERQVTDGDWNDEQPSWSPDGQRIAFVSDRERDRHQRQWRMDVWVARSTGGRARKLTRSRGAASSPAFSPDGRLIAFVGHENGEAGSAKNAHLLVIPAEGGKAPRSLSAPTDRSVVGHPVALSGRAFAWLPNGKSLVFLAGDRGTVALYRADAANGSVSKVLGGERQIDAFALTPDGRRIVFAAIWVSEPGEIYSAALDGGGRERNLSHANDELRNRVELGRIRRMRYRAPDGLEIEAFVLYPPEYQRGKRYPIALEIHGGPHAFHPSGLSFMLFQSLAGAGYVVLLPNPRGSSTYGEEFTQACVGDWGGKDFEDLMTGVDELVRRGIADPDRLYVGGYSYGGFMTTWTVGHTDRFRAAIVGAPVANQVSMVGTDDIPRFDVYELGATPFDNPEEYRQRSPVTYLANVKTPVLLVHHEGDLRCPIGQSEEIFQGLKMLGKEVEFARYPGGFHVARTSSQQVDRMKRGLAWYESHAPAKLARRRGTGRRGRAQRRGAAR
ncbi:MAG: S9 family peptidase [Dehalococcoidia bacterium]